MPYTSNREDSLPIVFNLTEEDAITQNSYWERAFALYYLDDLGAQVLWEFDGVMASGHAAIKPTHDDAAVLSLTTTNGGVVFGPTVDEDFSFKLVLQHGDTSALDDWGKGVWDIYVIDASGRKLQLYKGDAALARNVTP